MADAEYTEMVDHSTYQNFENDRAGYGLCQWTYPTRKAALLAYAKKQGKSIGDLEMQLGFLMQELSTGYKSLLALTNQNLAYNPAYSLASDARTTANQAYSLADDAYYEAQAAYNRADRAYKLADSIEMPRYIKSTYIDSTTIRSPVIEGGEFYGGEFNVIAGSSYGSFNLYGPYGSSRYHMFTISYYEGDAPYIDIYSPCGGYITIGGRSGVVYFEGRVDFTRATVTGLE